MLKKFGLFLVLFSILATSASAEELTLIGKGVRQNTVMTTFDSYSLVHYASSSERNLAPHIERMMQLTMLADWGMFFTKNKMVEALEQALHANMSDSEFASLTSEIDKFKRTLLQLPINRGTELKFHHIPGAGLEISMKAPNGFRTVLKSSDQNFSLKIMAIWLGKADQNANNRGSLERLIEDLWGTAN